MNRPLVASGIAVLVIAAIIGVVVFFQLPSPDTPPTQAQAPATAPRDGSGPSQTASTGQPGQDEPAPQPAAPEFDIVRVDDNGNAVIAGQATPDCTVIVRDGDTVIGTVTVDRRGDWVLVPDEPLVPGQRELSVTSQCGDEAPVPSDRVVVLAVPEEGSGALAVAVPRQGFEPSQVLQTPATPPVAGTVPRDGAEPSRVAPTASGGEVDAGATPQVAVAAVDYDDAGEVALSGTAKPGSTVQVYVDNELVGRATADEKGRWTLTPERKIDPGSYELRVDQVTPEGKVVARAQIPFVRGEPLTDLPGGRVVIIQPGDYLWRIARERYGSGFQYTLIYDANREQIRDPDLIFPGQIFMVPTVN